MQSENKQKEIEPMVSTTVKDKQSVALPQPLPIPHPAEQPQTPISSLNLGLAFMTPVAHTTPSVALLSSVLANNFDPIKLYVEFTDVEKINKETLTKYFVKEMKVVFSGVWDGKLLKGAIRSIENAYRQIKHEKLRDSAAKKAREAKS